MEANYYLPSMSSLKNSSSSVRNLYGNSSDIIKNGRKNSYDMEYEYVGVKCKCDLPAPCQEAWKEGTLDPGRRFFGSSQYKDPRKKCNFFLWADPSYPDKAREVIKELKLKMRKKDDDLHNARVDVNFVERKMLVLHEKLCLLRKKNEEAVALLKKMEKNCVLLKRLLAVAIVVIMFWLVKYD